MTEDEAFNAMLEIIPTIAHRFAEMQREELDKAKQDIVFDAALRFLNVLARSTNDPDKIVKRLIDYGLAGSDTPRAFHFALGMALRSKRVVWGLH